MEIQIDDTQLHHEFQAADRRHVLMITNHGMHEWDVTPGLPDTGGQNVFVNQFTDALVDQGFRVTIANRGGFAHPETGLLHRGIFYKHAQARILYLEDRVKDFVRKEDMHEHLSELNEFLVEALQSEGIKVDLILSHYWDGAKLGLLFQRAQPSRIVHIWTPHSLGAIKKRHVDPEHWERLRIDERIDVEKEVIPKLDGVVSTSNTIRASLEEDYDYHSSLFLPPCVNPERFFPHDVPSDAKIWEVLGRYSDHPVQEIRQHKIVTEISRTVRTKRKDILIQAFAQVVREVPEALLVINLDESRSDLTDELESLVDDLGVRRYISLITEEVRDEDLPDLYALSSCYCTASVMEGFGMAVQEAAATSLPVIGSEYVPFVVEFLVGEKRYQEAASRRPYVEGEGGIVVEADDIDGFAKALSLLLRDDAKRRRMGERARQITIPYFTWDHRVKDFLQRIPKLS